MTYPLPKKEKIWEFYSRGFYSRPSVAQSNGRVETHFEDFLLKTKLRDMRSEAQFRFMRPFLPTGCDKSALDVGCSTGHLLFLLQRMGFLVHGYDPDPEMAAIANKKIRMKTQAVIQEMFDIALEKQSYDLVCSSHLIEHLEDPVQYIRNMAHLLKPRGILFVEVPNDYDVGLRKVLNPEIYSAAPNLGHISFFSPKALKRLILKAGFRVIRLQTAGVSAYRFFPNSIVDESPIYGTRKLIRLLKNRNIIPKPGISRLYSLQDNYRIFPQRGISIRLLASAA